MFKKNSFRTVPGRSPALLSLSSLSPSPTGPAQRPSQAAAQRPMPLVPELRSVSSRADLGVRARGGHASPRPLAHAKPPPRLPLINPATAALSPLSSRISPPPRRDCRRRLASSRRRGPPPTPPSSSPRRAAPPRPLHRPPGRPEPPDPSRRRRVAPPHRRTSPGTAAAAGLFARAGKTLKTALPGLFFLGFLRFFL